MPTANTLQNAQISWVGEPTPNPGFGRRRPALLACASANKPSKKCGSCAHTLACVSMTVYAYRCSGCGVRALWIEEINQWVWPEEPECAHEFVFTAELCWRCQANMDALRKMREQRTAAPRTITVTDSTAVPASQSYTGTATGDFPYADIGTTGSKKIQCK